MHADERLMTFLLDSSARCGRRGYSRSQFVFRMTCQEIGSYLGLKLETMSCELSLEQQHGVIQLRAIYLTSPPCGGEAALRPIVDNR